MSVTIARQGLRFDRFLIDEVVVWPVPDPCRDLNCDVTWHELVELAHATAYGRTGRRLAREHADRYAAGTPLVRHHRSAPRGWSWLCPVPTCLEWRTSHVTEDNARITWALHAAAQHRGYSSAWPSVTS